MKLVGKKILVRQFQTKTMTDGGIALPEQTVQKLPVGVVVKVSPEVKNVLVNQVVMFGTIGAIPVTVARKEYALIEPEDVLMILEEGEYDAS